MSKRAVGGQHRNRPHKPDPKAGAAPAPATKFRNTIVTIQIDGFEPVVLNRCGDQREFRLTIDPNGIYSIENRATAPGRVESEEVLLVQQDAEGNLN